MSVRIVSILGLGSWDPKRFVHPDDDQWPTFYERCRHRFDGELSETVTHMHDVPSIEAVRRSGRDVGIVVLATKTVRERWFDHDTQYYRRALAEADCLVPFEPMLIPEEIDVGAVWGVFDTVTAALDSTPRARIGESTMPEEIWVDVSHGYRSHVVLAVAAVAYVQSQRLRMKDEDGPAIRLIYAAFDARDKKPDDGAAAITPVWDLTGFLDLHRWNGALDSFMRHGRADDLEVLISDVERSHRKTARSREEHEALNPLRQFVKAAKTFADALVTSRVPDLITQHARALHEAIGRARPKLREVAPPVAKQLDTLDGWVEPIVAKEAVSPAGVNAALALATLYERLQRYSELAALLRETLVTAWTLSGSTSQAVLQPVRGGDPEFDNLRHADESALGAAFDSGVKHDAARLFRQFGPLRNDVLHCGFNTKRREPHKIRAELPKWLEEMNEASITAPLATVQDRAPIFLNCSNHPSHGWSAEQRAAAETLADGEIIDFTFPQVPPDAPSEDVSELAQSTIEAIETHNAAVVHIAGELTLCFAMIAALQRRGARVVCATTTRNTHVNPDGSKTSRFEFVSWREYAR